MKTDKVEMELLYEKKTQRGEEGKSMFDVHQMVACLPDGRE